MEETIWAGVRGTWGYPTQEMTEIPVPYPPWTLESPSEKWEPMPSVWPGCCLGVGSRVPLAQPLLQP